MGIDTGAQRDIQGHQCGYRHRCTQIGTGTAVWLYTQVHTQMDRDSSVGIDTGEHTVRQGHHCGYRHKCTQR